LVLKDRKVFRVLLVKVFRVYRGFREELVCKVCRDNLQQDFREPRVLLVEEYKF
jgi:hypothetical protein